MLPSSVRVGSVERAASRSPESFWVHIQDGRPSPSPIPKSAPFEASSQLHEERHDALEHLLASTVFAVGHELEPQVDVEERR